MSMIIPLLQLKMTKDAITLHYRLYFSVTSRAGGWEHTEAEGAFTVPPTHPLPVSVSVSLTTTDITTALCHAWCVTGSPRSGPGFALDNITGG